MKICEKTVWINPTCELVSDDQGCILSVVEGGTLVVETSRIRRMIAEGALVVVDQKAPEVKEPKKPKQEVK